MRPVLFQFGSLPVFAYGVMVAMGALAATYVGTRRARDVGFGVEQNGSLDGIAPVVVMRQAAEAGLDATGDDRHAPVCLASPLAIRQRRPIGPESDPPAR